MPDKFRFALLLLACFCISGLAEPATADEIDAVSRRVFESEIRPLLATRCLKCHGAGKQKGGLRLDSRAAMVKGGETGPAIAPRQPQESLLVEAIRHESLEMPPDGKLSDRQIEAVVRWIRAGADWPADVPVITNRDAGFTDEERDYWAFQPLAEVAPPSVVDSGWSRNQIDRFVFKRLREAKLQPAREASSAALVRRLYFDLLGVPPTPREVREFLEDSTSEAYPRLVDRLLQRPEYGERWARHWLDLVRYAESDGYKQDAYRPQAWRYRDYVVRAFNQDKPYDQFVQEQLAGDEIAADDPEAIIATGYLRHWIYEYNQRDVRTQWDNIINDVTDVTADVFLGLGMGCARCHDHKFDPILQKDYFRLRAFFAPLWPRDDLPLGDREQLLAYDEHRRRWERESAEVRRELLQLESPFIERARKAATDKFPLDIRPMIRKATGERKPLEQQLAEMANRQMIGEVAKLDFAKKLKGEPQKRWKQLRERLAEFDALRPKELPMAFTVRDVGPVAPVNCIPGDAEKKDVRPGYLSILDERDADVRPLPNSTGRRTALAQWITRPDNPLTTRVIVNRVWQQHFGRGLVSTASDFGSLGERPSHPELLDWLTRNFVSNGWSIKKLHRLIVTSATYRQSALRRAPTVAARIDPDNRLLWRMNLRRLDAEQIRDTMLTVSGELDRKRGGPSVEDDSTRRSIYLKVRRNSPHEVLRAFDGPDGFLSNSSRNVTTTPTQALLLINGKWSLRRAEAFADRLAKRHATRGTFEERLILAAYQQAFGREPSDDELRGAREFLEQQRSAIEAEAKAAPDAASVASIPGRPGRAALLSPDGVTNWQLASRQELDVQDFSIEAVIHLRSLYEDASVRTIASRWNNSKQQAGWSFGVTSKKSAYQPRNLILQLIGKDKAGKQTYEVVASNLRPELNRTYYVAATVKLNDTVESGVTFYLRELSNKAAAAKTASVKHQVVTMAASKLPLVVGGRAGGGGHAWRGMLDDIRLSAQRLDRRQLWIGEAASEAKAIGVWSFDGRDKPPLVPHPRVERRDPWREALVDFCHVLLNSNELLYVD